MKRTLFAVAALLAATAYAAPPAGPELAKEVPAESRFTLTATSDVSFGIGNVYTQRTLVPGAYQCDEKTFGLTFTPAAMRRTCSLTMDPNAVPGTATPTYTLVAGEGKTYRLTEATLMRFGANGQWRTATLQAGNHWCDRSEFGGIDPIFGVVKTCERVTGAATITPTTPTTPVVVPPTMPVVTTPTVDSDVSTPEAYRKVAALMGTEAGIEYRYGKPSTAALPTTTYPGPRPSQSMMALSGQQNPLVRFADGKLGGRGCGADRKNSWCGTFQIGTPGTTIPDQGVPGQTVTGLLGEPGDYSSSIINVAYLPDVPVTPGFLESKYWGVASLQTVNIGHGSVSWKPEPSWTTWINPAMNDGDNDENTVRLAGVRSGSPIGAIALDAKPVASARGFGRGGWVNNVLTVFANGAITSAGSNTSHNFVKHQLPAGKTPTAIAITNSGEFALVTVWDTAALKGQIAVLALSDGCQGCETKPESQWEANWGSARGAYPGMPGLGNYVGIKLVGFVDLPENMKAPTEIAVTTGKPKGGYFGYERVQNFFNDHMQSAANRASYYSGEMRGAIARTGMAVVISKSERRAAFVDLRPLFQYYREQYVGPQTDAQWNAKIAARGPTDTQFPLGFASAPQQRPTVIKVVDLDSKPTAVRMMPNAPHRALLATEDGKLRLIALGDKYLDQDAVKVGAPADIAEISSINVGSNPTSIAHVDEKARLDNARSYLWNDTTAEEYFWWVLSRGERKATMLRLNSDATQFSVYRTLQDSRMVDPIAIYDGANHGTESYLLTVLGFSNRSVSSYLYGPLVMHTYPQSGQWAAPCTRAAPCAPQGGQPFEYTGEHKLPGKPFQGGLSNIN